MGGRFRNVLAVLIILAIAGAVGWQYFHEAHRARGGAFTHGHPELRRGPAADGGAARPGLGPGQRLSSGSDSARRGATTSTSSSATTVATPATTSCAATWPTLQVRPGTCFAQSGVLHDPYTGATIDFVRGPDTSSAVQIDHVVSLSDAWYKGARLWDDQRRRDFANDPRNLLAVGRTSQLRQGFSRCRVVAAAQRRRSGAPSSPAWSR